MRGRRGVRRGARVSWSDPEFGVIAGLLTGEFGVAFPPARRVFAEAAIRRALNLARERGLASYRKRLAAEPALLRALIAEVTIGETYFFRDAEQFEAIRSIVLPDVEQRRTGEVPLRIWSAGCSTGEEAYSLMMLVNDCGLSQRTLLLATDVSSTSIETARRGQYGAWSFRRDVGDWRERCFVRTGKRWTIAAAHRRVEFMVHNLMQPAPTGLIAGGGFDLIVCRNVLLYFDRKTVERAAHLLADALAPGGWLLMSPTDPPLPAELGLESVLTPAGIIFRKPVAVPIAGDVAVPRQARDDIGVAVPVRPRANMAAVPRQARDDMGHDVRSLQHEVGAAHRDKVRAASRVKVDAEAYVERAMTFLDASQPHQAAASARRALFLDRSLAVAHLTLARALRLTGSRPAALRALRRGAALLEAHAPEDVVRGAGGASAGTLSAVAAAEFELLVGATDITALAGAPV
jgi:chemotaxis protein methyltransferase CheR